MADRPYGRHEEVSYEPSLPSNRLELMLQQRRPGGPLLDCD